MPWDSGTATDHQDLLDRLITFLTGGALVNVSGTVIPSNQVWTVLKNEENTDTGTYSNNSQTQIGTTKELYLRGPGLGATATIITGVSNNGSNKARFTFTAGPTLTVDQEVVLSGFTNNNYNGVYLVDTTNGTSYFDIDSIDFLATGTGSFLTNAEAIYLNIRRYTTTATLGNADNWEINAADSFNTTLDFRLQPGSNSTSISASEGAYCPLSSDPFNYWFVATGRYFWVVASISGTTKVFGGGFYLPYATPSEFPYPIFVVGNCVPGGSGVNREYDIRWSISTNKHLNFYAHEISGVGWVRHRDGVWLPTFDAFAVNDTAITIWPTNQTTAYGNIYNQDTPRTYTCLPYIFHSLYDLGNVYGQVENLYWVSGADQADQNIVIIDGVDHLVIQNVWRPDFNFDFAALKLE
ncbi:MAG: hypothetical protein ABUK08_00060 [Candidatus Humimicrobiaceae bacterium]